MDPKDQSSSHVEQASAEQASAEQVSAEQASAEQARAAQIYEQQANSTSAKVNGAGIGRVYKAMFCSFKGFSAAYRFESAFRQELILCLVLLPFSFVLASTALHWALLIVVLLLLLLVELLNSAIEAITDRVGTEYHELSGRAKDIASAAVFLALMIVAVVWFSALWSYW